MTFNSGALVSTPNAPPGNIDGPRARFFVHMENVWVLYGFRMGKNDK